VREEGDAMAESTRALAAGVVAVAVILGADWVVDAMPGQDSDCVDESVAREDPRVRTDDPVVSTLIQRATDRSQTFRSLVEAIQATDGVVYIQRGRCGQHHVRACLLLWMTIAGPNRMLRVVVDDSKTDLEAMASLAHELRHALEVLQQASVRTGYDMYFFYRLGHSIKGETFETRAAIEAEDAVHRELKRR
jgi:hypothetical protein